MLFSHETFQSYSVKVVAVKFSKCVNSWNSSSNLLFKVVLVKFDENYLS